jgi:hypothetical protein
VLVDDEGDGDAGGADLSGERHGDLQLGALGGSGGDFLREDAGDPSLSEGVELCVEGLPGGRGAGVTEADVTDWFGVGAHGLPNFNAGEDIFILDQGTRPVPPPVIDHDYWLLDDEIVIRMYYSGSGEYEAAELIEGDIDMYRAARDAALAAAEPFPG